MRTTSGTSAQIAALPHTARWEFEGYHELARESQFPFRSPTTLIVQLNVQTLVVHLELPNLYQNEQRGPLTIFKMGWWMARLSDTGRDSWLSRAVSLISPSLIRLGLALCLYTD
jgi:hypothetical protein